MYNRFLCLPHRCSSIAFLMKTMPLKWVIEHQLLFAKALMFVMMDLTNEVSAGTVDSAKETLEKLIRQCNNQDEKVNIYGRHEATDVEKTEKSLYGVYLFMDSITDDNVPLINYLMNFNVPLVNFILAEPSLDICLMSIRI